MNYYLNNKNIFSKGFSLIELMFAMLIGIIIIGGVMGLYSNSRETNKRNEDQLRLVSDARFAIDTIAYDLRHAGMYGGTNDPSILECFKDALVTTCPTLMPAGLTGDCTVGWYMDLYPPVFATNGTNPYGSTCATQGYTAGTDVLSIHYADSNPVLTGDLAANFVYIRSNSGDGRIFVGPTQPVINSRDTNVGTKNYRLFSRVYYISDYTDVATDGIPSLHRVELNGPQVDDEVLLSGVVNLQVQLGIDTDGDNIINQYVDASNMPVDPEDPQWGKVLSAKIWLLLRSEYQEKDIDTAQTFNMGGQSVAVGGIADYRYLMVSTVVNLRNMLIIDQQSVGT